MGLSAGMLAAFLTCQLPARAEPLPLLVVLISTLLAGRLAPIGPALAHGLCAWAVLVIAGFLTHRVHSAWHGIPAHWLMLVLVEDMALIGRVGYVRRLMAVRNDG